MPLSLYDALSYFSDSFAERLEDPANVELELERHAGESREVIEAIRVLGVYGVVKVTARKRTRAARTLAGRTAIEFLFAVGGRASYGELYLTVSRRHKMAGIRNQRVLDELERAGVFRIDYSDPHVPVVTFGPGFYVRRPLARIAGEFEPLRDSSAYELGRRDRAERRPRLSAESFRARLEDEYELAPYSYSYYVRGYDNYRPTLGGSS